MNIFNYNNLTSRNNFFIDQELQQTIRKTKLIFAGCGLSSIMIEMAVRMGFENFILIDNDRVELSNLNRQAFTLSDCAELKINALYSKILNINPYSNITLMPDGITNDTDLDEIIDLGDIIINTIDYGKLYFDLVDHAMKKKRLTICPFNPGFGGLVVCFNERSGTVYDLLNTDQYESGSEFSRKLIKNNSAIVLPKEIRDNIDQLFTKITLSGYDPQIAIGVNMSSSIGLNCIIKYLNAEEIPYCPSIIYRGLYSS